jgi:ABC-type amino acid transport system permease subunit
MLGTVCHAGCGSTPKSTIVLFMVLGAVLAVFARRFTLWSLRPYFSKQRLAELDQPGQRRLRMFVNFSRGTGVLIGLFFVVTGIVGLLK